jgi:pyridoxamine 5'-phosphate oxidase
MQKDLGKYRKAYKKSALTEDQIPADPFGLFQLWFTELEASEAVEEPNAMTVSTIGSDGYPKARVVLLKHYSREGFVFYTNYESEKGKAIAENSKVCISFFWPQMERQVIIKGTAAKVTETQSDAYFASRPEGSKLGAMASDQSTVIASREILDMKLEELRRSYRNKEIKRPGNWGGYLVGPVSMEFWQGRDNRLHDRILYSHITGLEWKRERLAP